MPLVRAIFVFGLLALAGAIAVGTVRPTPDAAATSARFRDDAVRGMTVSCPRSGRIWATDATVESMRTLRDLGVTWVAIHPYGSISTDGTVGLPRDLGSGDDAWLTRPIAEAHALGLRIMVKPHLAYWHSRRFGWRGDIEFANDEAWDRFFTTYETWITTLATVCRDADLFVVGTELERTVQHESAWRTIIASVRARTGAPLTWAANWDGYTRVPFWDALDAVGVQAYFPLVTHEDVPRADELAASWARIIATLDAFGAAADRPVLLTEFGYDRSSATAREPWVAERRGADPSAELVQGRCLDAALVAIDAADRVVGGFLWKWFPGESSRGSHLMSTPAMREVIGARWRRRDVESAPGSSSGPSAPSPSPPDPGDHS